MEQDRLSTDFQASRQQQKQNAVWVSALGSCLLVGSRISLWGSVGTGNIGGGSPRGLGKEHRRPRSFQPAQPRGSSPGAPGFTFLWFVFGAVLSRAVPQTALPTQCSQEGTQSTKRMQNVRLDSQLRVSAASGVPQCPCAAPKAAPPPLPCVPLPAPGP